MEVEFLLFFILLMNFHPQMKTPRRLLTTLRDANDPFAIQEWIFVQNFRFPKTLCWEVIQSLKPFDNQRTSLPFVIRFLSVLYFLGHGSYQKCVGNNFTIPLSQATVSRNVTYICKHIVQVKKNTVCFPTTTEECMAKKIGFYSKFHIKGTIGAIDCTHIPIVTPKSTDDRTPAQLYVNRKGFYSVNVEAICDHNLRFLQGIPDPAMIRVYGQLQTFE